MMITITATNVYLGKKISYNYILYNASITFGSGVIFFLVKMIVTIDVAGKIEQLADIVITMLLILVFFMSLVETLVIEVMENGKEIKGNLQTFTNKVKAIDRGTIKQIPGMFHTIKNKMITKSKSLFPVFISYIKKVKLIDHLIKNKVINKKV